MENLSFLILCFLLGFTFQRVNRFPANTSQVLNQFILFVSLPSLVLYHIHGLEFSVSHLSFIAMPWMLIGFAILSFGLLYKYHFLTKSVFVCLVLTAGFGNTSFVGFPILESYLGARALSNGILIDQAGTFLALSLAGLLFLSIVSGSSFRMRDSIQKLMTFPPFLALIVASVLRPFPFPPIVSTLLLKLGGTLPPLALFSVGFLLKLNTLKLYAKPLLIGLTFKLFFAPIFFYFFYKTLVPLDRFAFQVVVLEASMAPMVTSSILAIEEDYAPGLAVAMLGLGIPISFASTYFWFMFLNN